MTARWVLLLSVIIGFISTVAVAWSCALWSKVDQPLLRSPVDVAAIIVADGHQDRTEVVRAGFGYMEIGGSSIVAADAQTHDVWQLQSPHPVLLEARAGWPLPCLAYKGSWGSEGEIGLRYGIVVKTERVGADVGRRLPVSPLGAGLAFNTLAYSSFVAAAALLPGWARARWRVATGRCRGCGYCLLGTTRCPECGWRSGSRRAE